MPYFFNSYKLCLKLYFFIPKFLSKMLFVNYNLATLFTIIYNINISLAYASKGCILVEVLPVPNAYTTSEQTTGVFSMFYFRMWCTH